MPTGSAPAFSGTARGQPRSIFRQAGVYPLPDPPQPVLTHEPEGSLWRRRADLTVSLRVRDEQIRQAEAVASAPQIRVIRLP